MKNGLNTEQNEPAKLSHEATRHDEDEHVDNDERKEEDARFSGRSAVVFVRIIPRSMRRRKRGGKDGWYERNW